MSRECSREAGLSKQLPERFHYECQDLFICLTQNVGSFCSVDKGDNIFQILAAIPVTVSTAFP